MTANERQELLRRLILLLAPAKAVAKDLQRFSWDSREMLVTLTRSDAAHVLDAYMGGALDERGVEEWANVVESRDDIGFEAGSEALLKEFVFQMANPTLTAPLSRAAANDWRRKLQ